jgi:hypothetical protein
LLGIIVEELKLTGFSGQLQFVHLVDLLLFPAGTEFET